MVAWVHCNQKGLRLGKQGMQKESVLTYREERPHLVIAEGGADWKIPAWCSASHAITNAGGLSLTQWHKQARKITTESPTLIAVRQAPPGTVQGSLLTRHWFQQSRRPGR